MDKPTLESINFDIRSHPLIQSYIKDRNFDLPQREHFIYSPRAVCSFAERGQRMVDAMIRATPAFKEEFDKLYPVGYQKKVAHSFFDPIHEKAVAKVAPEDLQDISKLKYYEVRRKFPFLVSSQYFRTKAPRISTKGSTFHGMKKDLKLNILKELSLKGFKMLDCDMSACHSRVAASILRKESSQIKFSLEDGNFWKGQVGLFKPTFAKYDVDITEDTIKKILKVMLYTSLNGGNPGSEARLFDNLKSNAKDYINKFKLNLNDPEVLLTSNLYYAAQEVAGKFELARELKELNKACVKPSLTRKIFYTFTVDRYEPYESESVHYGISRVLQGFEVILLSVLTRIAVSNNCLPISLDHDGILLLLNPDIDESELMAKFNDEFIPWSDYLLDITIPLEIKLMVKEGEIV